jgi:exoribonuclease II
VHEEGRITGWAAAPSVIESRARLSYEEADDALANPDHPLSASLRALRTVAEGWREERLANGALEMDRPEVKVAVDAEGRVEVSVVERPTASRRLVAEFMIMANRLLGEFCRDQGIPAVYRTQAPVSMEGIAETSVAPVRQYQILRRVRAAAVSGSPSPHALLGLPVYAQATSPIRRYTDLVVQRQVSHVLRHGAPLYDEDEVEEVVRQAREQLRDLARVEGDRRQYWLLKLLATCIGETYPAVVLEVRDRHALLELERLMLRTTVYLGPAAAVGDTVPLCLGGVDLWRRQAFFTYDPDGTAAPSQGAPGSLRTARP